MPIPMKQPIFFTFFLLAWIFPHSTFAQLPPDSIPVSPAEVRDTLFDYPTGFSLLTPRQAVESHLRFLNEPDYNAALAARTLQGAPKSSQERQKLAIWLKQIYDGEGYYVDPDEIPDDPNYVDSLTGRARWVVYSKYPDLFVSKVNGEWKYAARTVHQIPRIHRKIFPLGTQWLLSLSPKWGNRMAMGLKLWQLQGILILVLMSLVLYFLLDKLLHLFIRRIIPRIFPKGILDRKLVPPVAHPLSFLLVTLFLQVTTPSLFLSVGTFHYLDIILKILVALFAVFTLLRIIDLISSVSGSLASRTETAMDDQLIPLVRKIIKLIVIVTGVLFVLQNLDVNITALLAGVSIGGLALALAAQDTVKNFIGSITIFTDRPFQIGDYIETPKGSGSVIEVGVRSTRLIASDGAQISIPNGELANLTITNHGVRTYRRYATNLGLSYDTTPDKIEAFVQKVREMVRVHPSTRDDGHNIYFHEMGESSLNVSFQVFFELTGYADMLAARQDLFLSIMREAEQMGISFAFPSTSVYVEKLPFSSDPINKTDVE